MSPAERLKAKLVTIAGPMLLETKLDLVRDILCSLDEEEKIELANQITRFLRGAEWAIQQMSYFLEQEEVVQEKGCLCKPVKELGKPTKRYVWNPECPIHPHNPAHPEQG